MTPTRYTHPRVTKTINIRTLGLPRVLFARGFFSTTSTQSQLFSTHSTRHPRAKGCLRGFWLILAVHNYFQLKPFACTMTLTIASIYCWVIFLQMAFLTIDQGTPSAIIITYSLGGWAQRNLQVVVVVEQVMINTLESIRIK